LIRHETLTSLNTIAQPAFAALSGAIRTAKYFASRCFDPVPDDLAAAMITGWRHYVDGALEAIKDVRCPIALNFECLVVFVSAMFAFGHNSLLLF
jgi:hypothetical protein